MSRLDELDHRIGRHDDAPNPDCVLCVGVKPDEPDEDPWQTIPDFFSGNTYPRYPNWGDLWSDHRGQLSVFAKGSDEKPYGFWVPVEFDWQNVRITDSIFAKVPPTQTEIGTGHWAKRVQVVRMESVLPNETTIRSPLGVDLPKWAAEQNRAKLIVHMDREVLVPISEIQTDLYNEPALDQMKVSSTIHAVAIDPFERTRPEGRFIEPGSSW